MFIVSLLIGIITSLIFIGFFIWEYINDEMSLEECLLICIMGGTITFAVGFIWIVSLPIASVITLMYFGLKTLKKRLKGEPK